MKAGTCMRKKSGHFTSKSPTALVAGHAHDRSERRRRSGTEVTEDGGASSSRIPKLEEIHSSVASLPGSRLWHLKLLEPFRGPCHGRLTQFQLANPLLGMAAAGLSHRSRPAGRRTCGCPCSTAAHQPAKLSAETGQRDRQLALQCQC